MNDRQILELIASIEAQAKCFGLTFVVDQAKLAAFRAAQRS